MGLSSFHGPGLPPVQIRTLKLSVSAACRRMTADQILEIADHLHAIIRKRGTCCDSVEVAAYDPSVEAVRAETLQ